MKRRAFVQAIGSAAAGAFVVPLRGPVVGLRRAAKLERVGLELYAVRRAMRADPERTLAAVRVMGYDEVELLWSFDNFARTPQQVRATLDHEGLRAPSAHMAPEVILKDWDKSLEKAQLLGHQYLVVPSLPDETQHSLDAWRQWADRWSTECYEIISSQSPVITKRAWGSARFSVCFRVWLDRRLMRSLHG
jgi:hypothetical protein